MSFPSKKVVFSRFNRKKLQPSFRSRTRIFGALNDTKRRVEQSEIQDLVERWNCVLYVIDGETVLKLLSPVNIESLEEVWKWAKDNVNVEGVQSYLVKKTERNSPDNLKNRKYNIPEKMMLKIDTEEWQYFLIQEGTEFSMARIELEDVPREWGGFKLWMMPQKNKKISIEVVATLKKMVQMTNMPLNFAELNMVVRTQVMSYLEKTRIDNVGEIVMKTCETPYHISKWESLKATEKCWVDYYKKRWILVKQENNKMTWARIDWRNERYYLSVVGKVNDKFKFAIQNQEIKQSDQPENQQLKDQKIKSIDIFEMRIPGENRDLKLQVMKMIKDKPINVEVTDTIEVEGSDNQGMKMEDRVKNAVETYMRREQGEYGEMNTIMNIKSRNSEGEDITYCATHYIQPKEPTLVSEMEELTWIVIEVDDCKLTLKKTYQVEMGEMTFTLTMEVEYTNLKSPGQLINPQQKVMVTETPEGITLSFITEGDKHYQILKRVSTNTFRIRAKDNDGIEWDVISTGFGDSLKVKRKERDNDGNYVLW
jgi:hypothetical protein